MSFLTASVCHAPLLEDSVYKPVSLIEIVKPLVEPLAVASKTPLFTA